MKGMDEIFDELMVKGDGDMARLRGQQQFQEPMIQLADQVAQEDPRGHAAGVALPPRPQTRAGPLPDPDLGRVEGQLGHGRAHRDGVGAQGAEGEGAQGFRVRH